MQRVVGRKCAGRLHVGEYLGLHFLGERDALLPCRFAAAYAAHQHRRVLRARQELRGSRDRRGLGLHGIRGAKARYVRQRRQRADLRFLQRGVQIDVRRSARRRARHLHCAHEGFIRGGDRARLVVPLGVVAYQRALVRGGVDPVDPRPASRRVPWSGRAEDQHRHAIAPGVEDRHRGVHQPDVRMDDRAHQLAGGARIAMGERDRGLLVQAKQHLRPLVAEVVDDAVVKAAIARARVQRQIRDVQRAQHRRDAVAAPMLRSLRYGRGNIPQDFLSHLILHECLPP